MTSAIVDRDDPAAPGINTTVSHIDPRGASLPRVLIVGAGDLGRQLAASLQSARRHQVIGFIDDDIDNFDNSSSTPWPVLGRRHVTTAIVREHAIDEVIVAYAPTWQQVLAEELAAECPHVGIRVVPSPFESLLRVGYVENYGDIALVRLTMQAARLTETIKRVFDICVSTATFLLLFPFLLLIALLIKATSRGPVIFAQERIGRYGEPFMVYKFRTMIHDAEKGTGPTLSSGKRDSRLTPLGRWLRLFRADEIPQLWNVLRGEMSLVGPRPERPVFVQKFQCMVPSYARRHAVRPGITGLAQICGGYHTDARDKLRFDLIYVSHQSLWLDISILLRTILVVILPDHH